jgi:hypothetical protein
MLKILTRKLFAKHRRARDFCALNNAKADRSVNG